MAESGRGSIPEGAMDPSPQHSASLDTVFREAVAAIDAGDVGRLERLVSDTPSLVCERLTAPGAWLRETVGEAVDGFFAQPYLLWFVAEDPVRNARLPRNIAAIAQTIINAGRRECADRLQAQLDYALTLVCWSRIAAQYGVQLELIDVLVNAGAVVTGNPDNALVNGNFAAAEHLLTRGAAPTLATALFLDRWSDVDRLLTSATDREKQFAMVLSALHGRAAALRRMISGGGDVNAVSPDLYPHGTPLHHAVSSGSLEAVRVLVEAGADATAVDGVWGGTPLGWAEYALGDELAASSGKQRAEIAAYLRATETSPTRGS
jgi:ankyrin repeat protein